MIAHTLVGPLLQIFFTDHLVAQRRLSLQTVASYRDTFRLLLQFVHRETGIEPVALKIPGLDAEIILRFLDALEKDRGNTVVSRNLRLTATGKSRRPSINDKVTVFNCRQGKPLLSILLSRFIYAPLRSEPRP